MRPLARSKGSSRTWSCHRNVADHDGFRCLLLSRRLSSTGNSRRKAYAFSQSCVIGKRFPRTESTLQEGKRRCSEPTHRQAPKTICYIQSHLVGDGPASCLAFEPKEQRLLLSADAGTEAKEMMASINKDRTAQGLNFAAGQIEDVTIGQSRPSDPIHKQPFRWASCNASRDPYPMWQAVAFSRESGLCLASPVRANNPKSDDRVRLRDVVPKTLRRTDVSCTAAITASAHDKQLIGSDR